MMRFHFSKILLALLALVICTGFAQAATLVATPTSITLACDTTTGPVSGSVGIKLASAGSLLVTPSFAGGSPLATAPAAATVASTTTAVNFSFSVAAGCAGATNGQTVNLVFTPATGTALTVVATLNITGSPLTATPSSITLVCDTGTGAVAGNVGIKLLSAGSQLVTPSFAGGSPLATAPSAQTVASTTTAVNFSFSVAAGCAGATNGQTINLVFTPASGNALTVVATLSITGSPITATPTSITLACDTATGAVAGNVGIKLVSAGSLLVTPSFAGGSPLATAPAAATVASTTTAVNFSFSVAAGCANATNGQTVNLVFTPASGPALTVVATLSITGATLVAVPTSITLTCDTATGAVSSNIGIKLKAIGSLLVTPSVAGGSPIVVPGAATVASTTTAVNFAFSVSPGCSGATNGQTVNIIFTPASGTALTVVATLTVTSPTLVSSLGNAITVPCDTALGPTAMNLGITLASAGTTYTVTGASGAATVILTAPGSNSVSSTTVPVVWGIHAAAGCHGIVNGATVALTFTPTVPSGGQTLTVTATFALTNSASALAPSPGAVTVYCTKANTTYTPVGSTTVNVSSPANYGTPFTVDNTTNPLPSWLQISSLTGGTAAATPISFSVSAKSGCGGLQVGSTTFQVHLLSAPAPDKLLPVTIEIGSSAVLTAPTVSLSYVKGSGAYNTATSSITASAATYFSVDLTTLPLWANVSPSTGTTPQTLTFTPTAGAETLALGSYTATVHLKVSGDLDSLLTLNLAVQSATSSLAVSDGLTRTLSWTLGTTLPSLIVTPISSGSPIPYTVTVTNGTLFPQVAQSSGLAYMFGSPISVTFLQSAFAAAQPGTPLTGAIVIHPPTPASAVTVNIIVNILSPAATITSISPAALPTASSGTFTVALTGNGFVTNAGGATPTNVGVLSGGLIVQDANITPNVVNANSIILSIAVPASSDPFLPFSGNGGTVQIGVCNPGTGTCSTPTGSTSLSIGINPIVQAVTSASSFMQATPPALTAIAPYDIVSIFGANFCISGATGCVNPAVMYGTTDPTTLRYLSTLSPDAAGATQRSLSVTFQTHGGSPTAIANAPLLFATNNQINLLVPSAVATYVGNTVDIVVNFGYGSGSTLLSSAAFPVTIAAVNPGIFALAANGQGDAAALMPVTYALISQTTPAGINLLSADTIQLYVTGLGVPDSDGTSGAWSASCMPAAGYFAAVNTATGVNPALASDDGLVLLSTYFPVASPAAPCFVSTGTMVPTITVGNVAATVGYAGWVSGSVAGLYQVNVQIPSTAAFNAGASILQNGAGTTVTKANLVSAVALPITMTTNGVSAQPTGVNLWVKGKLSMASTALTTGGAATTWTGAITATGGTGTITYSVLTGSVPAGITFDTSAGTFAGSPTGGIATSTVVFKAQDATGWTGTISVTFDITS